MSDKDYLFDSSSIRFYCDADGSFENLENQINIKLVPKVIKELKDKISNKNFEILKKYMIQVKKGKRNKSKLQKTIKSLKLKGGELETVVCAVNNEIQQIVVDDSDVSNYSTSIKKRLGLEHLLLIELLLKCPWEDSGEYQDFCNRIFHKFYDGLLSSSKISDDTKDRILRCGEELNILPRSWV